MDTLVKTPKTNQRMILQALENSLAVLETGAGGAILSVNGNYLNISGYEKGDLSGRHRKILCPGEAVLSSGYQALWGELRAGGRLSGLFRPQRKDGSDFWMEDAYSMLFSNDGQPEKAVTFCPDMTPRIRTIMDKRSILGVLEHSFLVATYSPDGAFLSVNHNFAAILGRAGRDMVGKRPADVGLKWEGGTPAGEIWDQIASGRTVTDRLLWTPPDGAGIWLDTVFSPVFSDAGQFVQVIQISFDVTRLVNAEHETGGRLRMEAGAMRDSGHAFTITTMSDKIIYANPGFARMFGYEENEIAGRFASFIFGPQEPAFPAAARERFARGQAHQSERIAYRKDGRQLWVSVLAKPVINEEDGRECVASVFTDITAIKSREKLQSTTLEGMARDIPTERMPSFYDPVTGLPNRELVAASAERLLASRGSDDPEYSMAVFYCSIDRFNSIIQGVNFEEGDAILKIIAGRITGAIDRDDLAGRVGAGEFAVIVPGCGARQALEKARRIRERASVPCIVNDIEFPINISVGISLFPNNGDSVEALLGCAIAGLAQQRNRGKGGAIGFFSKDMNARARDALSLESRLRKAIERNALHLCYQPQINLKSGRLHGVEALARWDDGPHGSIPPLVFVPLAEKSGLIEKLSDWVLREACRQMGDWRRRGVGVPQVAVNLSSPNFRDTRLPDRIATYLEENGLRTDDLILELTESVLLGDDPAVLATVGKVSSLGLGLALDDFGTGYSSFSNLRKLPFSEIKLDRSFVRDLHTEETSRRLSQAIILIGQGLKLRVLAEGVETMAQCQFLKQQQCHVVQGFLFSKPLRAGNLEAWAERWRPQVMEDQHRLI